MAEADDTGKTGHIEIIYREHDLQILQIDTKRTTFVKIEQYWREKGTYCIYFFQRTERTPSKAFQYKALQHF